MIATGSTQGALRLFNSRKSAYSRVANSSTVSFTAKTSRAPGPVRIKRTIWREMPRMLARPGSSDQSSTAFRHGRPDMASMSSLRPVIRSSLMSLSFRIIKSWRSRNPDCTSVIRRAIYHSRSQLSLWESPGSQWTADIHFILGS